MKKIIVRTGVKAGGPCNHNGRKIVVRTRVRAGALGVNPNHNARKPVVRTRVRSGYSANHNVRRA